jgi:hypothetical protein
MLQEEREFFLVLSLARRSELGHKEMKQRNNVPVLICGNKPYEQKNQFDVTKCTVHFANVDP